METCEGCIYLTHDDDDNCICIKFNEIKLGNNMDECFPIDNCKEELKDKSISIKLVKYKDSENDDYCYQCLCYRCPHDRCSDCFDVGEKIVITVKKCNVNKTINHHRYSKLITAEEERLERCEEKAREYEKGGRGVWASPTMGLPSLGKRR